jgi:phosphate:Na+ symporter
MENRIHIIEGLMKAVSILDEVIRIIRASKDKADAKKNLMKEYGFDEPQAEAIVSLRLYRLSNTRLKGVLLGTGVTAVIQSSSATAVMVVGFVNSGMMKLAQGINVIIGALLGTSITGWILCLNSLGGSGASVASVLNTEVLTGAVAVIGIFLWMFSKKTSRKNVGGIMMGFAVLMYGMSMMSGAIEPLR